jgi:predicted RNA binding protein YcfA (HicA-like mRNA interferase family)
VTTWPSTRAARVLAALLRIGWSVKRQRGSHAALERAGWPDFVWAFHDGDELGPFSGVSDVLTSTPLASPHASSSGLFSPIDISGRSRTEQRPESTQKQTLARL